MAGKVSTILMLAVLETRHSLAELQSILKFH